ncbi:uridine kinase family protein [Propionibacteriaceae bacterium G1746]|uniref:uridine kinase family protein n=1 Tax=Aestuariimicrobium sp. G57 TaxID=3418485 RepID=UPI003C1F9E49
MTDSAAPTVPSLHNAQPQNPQRHAPLLHAVADWVDEGARWIVIDGLGASGKTTLADQLVAHVDGLAVVHLDDFTRPGAVGWERERFTAQVWAPLQAGQAARYQRHHWTSPEPTDWVDLPAARAVLVEGIGASEPPKGVAWDRFIWLAAPESVRSERAALRDPGRFGCWSQNWRPTEQEWFDRTEPWRGADLVWVTA